MSRVSNACPGGCPLLRIQRLSARKRLHRLSQPHRVDVSGLQRSTGSAANPNRSLANMSAGLHLAISGHSPDPSGAACLLSHGSLCGATPLALDLPLSDLLVCIGVYKPGDGADAAVYPHDHFVLLSAKRRHQHFDFYSAFYLEYVASRAGEKRDGP
jgi:hypothetical protein